MKISDHAGLCDACRKWATEVTEGNNVKQLRIGQFASANGHKHTHYEIFRLYMIKLGVWHSLPAFMIGAEAEVI